MESKAGFLGAWGGERWFIFQCICFCMLFFFNMRVCYFYNLKKYQYLRSICSIFKLWEANRQNPSASPACQRKVGRKPRRQLTEVVNKKCLPTVAFQWSLPPPWIPSVPPSPQGTSGMLTLPISCHHGPQAQALPLLHTGSVSHTAFTTRLFNSILSFFLMAAGDASWLTKLQSFWWTARLPPCVCCYKHGTDPCSHHWSVRVMHTPKGPSTGPTSGCTLLLVGIYREEIPLPSSNLLRGPILHTLTNYI